MRMISAVLCGCAIAWMGLASQALAAPVLGDPCPNGDIRKTQGTSHLPDCMALEMVSPPQKASQPARISTPNLEGGGRSAESGAISPDGDRVLFLSMAALGDPPRLLRVSGDPYVASRDAAGQQWTTSSTAPANGMSFGPLSGHPQLFSSDLTRWLQITGSEAEYFAGTGRLYHGSLDPSQFMAFSPLLAPLEIPPGEARFLTIAQQRVRAASADLSTLVFRPGPTNPNRSTTRYIPKDPLPSGSSERNQYVISAGPGVAPSLELLTRDHTGKVWGGNCGADLPGNPSTAASGQGAVSADGSRIYFTTRPGQSFDSETGEGPACSTAANKLRILVREQTPAGPEIGELFESECNRAADPPAVPACGQVIDSFGFAFSLPGSDDVYQGGSRDGSRVYFTTSRQLTNSDTNGLNSSGFSTGTCDTPSVGGCDLYLWDGEKDEGEQLTQITASGTGTVVPRLVTLSGDGSRIYFLSSEALTTAPGPGGSTPDPGPTTGNMYVWDADAEELSFIATTGGLAAPTAWAVPVLGPDPGDHEAGGDGRWFVFASNQPLTADDTDGGKVDVFRYDAETAELERISKAAPGGSDNGAFDAVAGTRLGFSNTGVASPGLPTEYATRGRWVSEDAGTISFKTAEALVPEDTNGARDSYIWRDGELMLLPGTTDPGGALFDLPLVSLDGDLIAFQSAQQLLPRDGDTAMDVYMLRPEGGFHEPVAAQLCQPDADASCQGPPAPAPAASEPGSLTNQGRGNVAHTRNCAVAARRAARLSRQATRLRRSAARAPNARRAKALRQRSGRIAKRAKQNSNAAKRCRSANRRAAR